MNRRRLGRTGLEVSEIGFGCGTTAGLMIRGAPDERRDAVSRALELGIDYFDTAPVYGNTASEAHLGQAIRELGAKPHIATKVALEARDFDNVRGAVIRSVEESVGRLGIARITLIQLHNRVGMHRADRAEYGTGALLSVDDVLGAGGVVDAFRSLRDRGLVQFFGCSAFGGEPAAVDRVIDSGAFDTIIVNYSMLNRTAWVPAEPSGAGRDYAGAGKRAAAAGMGVIALRVLEGGILGGAAASAPIAAVSRREGLALPELAVRFALSNVDISTVLVGFSDEAQIEAAAGFAAHGPLSAATLSRIDELLNEKVLGSALQ